jgi:hypothetical protein
LTRKTQPTCITNQYERRCKKCQTDKSRCSWRGKSHEVVEGEVAITHKRSRGELAVQGNELSSGDEVEEVRPPRGKSEQLYLRFAANGTQRNL